MLGKSIMYIKNFYLLGVSHAFVEAPLIILYILVCICIAIMIDALFFKKKRKAKMSEYTYINKLRNGSYKLGTKIVILLTYIVVLFLPIFLKILIDIVSIYSDNFDIPTTNNSMLDSLILTVCFIPYYIIVHLFFSKKFFVEKIPKDKDYPLCNAEQNDD